MTFNLGNEMLPSTGFNDRFVFKLVLCVLEKVGPDKCCTAYKFWTRIVYSPTVFPLRILVLSQFGYFREILAQCKKTIERSERSERSVITAWGPGARLRALVGSRDKAPGGGRGGGVPGSSWVLAFYEAQKRLSPALFSYNGHGRKCYKTLWNKTQSKFN